jgi:EAL domain-containing protein (putative c-di-GMP-specific phosphodiesterase class I)
LLQSLREGGVRIGIDDFGTGYSSLAYLHRLPLDLLKVDRSFVNGMNDTDENAAIVRTIVALADNLSLDTIAEGVETAEQLEELVKIGCKYGQGYFFSRPLAAQQVAGLLQQAAMAQ